MQHSLSVEHLSFHGPRHPTWRLRCGKFALLDPALLYLQAALHVQGEARIHRARPHADVDEYSFVAQGLSLTCGVQGAANTNWCNLASDSSVVAQDTADRSGVDIFSADAQGGAEGQPLITVYPDGMPRLICLHGTCTRHLERSCTS